MHGTEQEYILGMAGDKKPEPLKIKQYDNNSRKARIGLTAFGKEWSIPAGALVYISTKKNDGTMAMDDCEIVDDNTVIAPISQQVALVEGDHEAELYILMPDGDIRSQTFTIHTYPAVMDQKTIESSNEFGALQNALLDVQTATSAARDAAAESLIQAGEAKEAAEIAMDAAASIDTAVEAAAAAKTSETNAKASEEAAARTKADVEALKEGFSGYDKIESGRKYANALTATAEGEGKLTVTDAWDAPVVDMEIDGASEQVVTTGAQLFDANNALYKNNASGGNDAKDIIKTRTGVRFTVNSTSGSVGVFTSIPNIDDVSGTFAISCTVTISSRNFNSIRVTLGSGLQKVATADDFVGNSMHFEAVGNVVLSNIFTFYVDNSGKPQDLTVEFTDIMVTKDELCDWEPYTGGQPSPSPAYPQAIKGVEHVVNSGAQLLDIKLPSVATKNGVTVSLSADGGIHLTGTATGSGNHRLIDPSQNIALNLDSATLSLQASGAYDGVVMVSDAADGEWKNLLSVKNNATATGTAKTSKLGCYVTYVAGTTYNVTLYPMLCASPTAQPWEPYNNQQRETNLQVDIAGKNLFNKNALYSYNVGAVDIVQLDKGTRISNATVRTYACAAVKLRLKPHTTYTFSGDITALAYKSMIGIRKSIDGGSSFIPDMVVAFSSEVPTRGVSRTFTTDENEYYALCLLCTNDVATNGTTTFENIQLEEGSTATAWELYHEPQTVTIPLDEPLHGIGDVRDRICLKDGVWGIERQFTTTVFDGSDDEEWKTENSLNNTLFTANLPSSKKYVGYTTVADILCDKLKADMPQKLAATIGESGIALGSSSIKVSSDVFIAVADYVDTKDVNLFRSWIAANPIEMVHPLATPTWTSFPAETQTALNALTTHPGTTYLTVASTDVAAPVRLTYVQDTRKVVDSLKLDLAEQMTELQAQIDQMRVTNNLI